MDETRRIDAEAGLEGLAFIETHTPTKPPSTSRLNRVKAMDMASRQAREAESRARFRHTASPKFALPDLEDAPRDACRSGKRKRCDLTTKPQVVEIAYELPEEHNQLNKNDDLVMVGYEGRRAPSQKSISRLSLRPRPQRSSCSLVVEDSGNQDDHLPGPYCMYESVRADDR